MISSNSNNINEIMVIIVIIMSNNDNDNSKNKSNKNNEISNNIISYMYDKLSCLILGMSCLTKRKPEHLRVLKWIHCNRISTY